MVSSPNSKYIARVIKQRICTKHQIWYTNYYLTDRVENETQMVTIEPLEPL